MFQKNRKELLFILCLASISTAQKIEARARQERPRIAVLSMAIGEQYRDAVRCGLRNKEEFCALHGYDFLCLDHILDASRPFAWNKIPWVQQWLSHYDWVMWSDADSLIMNTSIKIENFIDECYHFIIAKDNASNCVNSGQFFIKNSRSSHEFLRTVWGMEQHILHPWWEQQAIIETIEIEPFRNGFCKILPQKTFNSFAPELGLGPLATYTVGDFIIHFPSIRDLNRLHELMEGYVSGHLPEALPKVSKGELGDRIRPRGPRIPQARPRQGRLS